MNSKQKAFFYTFHFKIIMHASLLCLYLRILFSHPIAPGDFTSTTQLLSFSVTNTKRSVSIPIQDDSINEGTEHFFAILSTEQNVALNPSTAIIMISDNDGMFSIIVYPVFIHGSVVYLPFSVKVKNFTYSCCIHSSNESEDHLL